MTERQIWVERTFEFDLPVWMFPSTVERLCGGPARVEDIVRGVGPDVLTTRPGERWSIQEHVGHLLDLEPLWARRLDELFSGATQLTAWDVTNRATYEADHNSKPLEEILLAFRKARSKMVDRLDRLDGPMVERTAIHPRLQKPMRTFDLAYFVAEHDDHHLAEITRLKHEFA